DLLWGRLDHLRLVQPQRVEADRVLVALGPPHVVRQLVDCVGCVRQLGGKAFTDQSTRRHLGIDGTQIGRFEHGPQCAFRCNRISPSEVTVRVRQAAEVLRPRPVHCTVDDDPPDLSRPQLLWLGWETEKCVDRSLTEKPGRLREWMGDPRDIRTRIDSYIRQYAGGEHVLRLSSTGNGDGLALEIANGPYALGSEQLEATGMNTGQQAGR